MHDARDVEDKRLLEAGDHKLLLAGYFHPVRELCFLRLRDREAADEAAQIVFLRLLSELKRGKTYACLSASSSGRSSSGRCAASTRARSRTRRCPTTGIPPPPTTYEAVEDDYDFGLLIADLPDRQREVLDLIHREGLSPEQAAERLGIKRNAVDQALHNGHRKLAEKLGA